MTQSIDSRDQPGEPHAARGAPRLLAGAAGFFFLGLAVLGFFLPVLPCTPFVLLASAFFARSSPRLHCWLRNSRFFGGVLKDWEEKKGVRRAVKIRAILMVVLVITVTICSVRPAWPVALAMLSLVTVGLFVIARLPTVDSD